MKAQVFLQLKNKLLKFAYSNVEENNIFIYLFCDAVLLYHSHLLNGINHYNLILFLDKKTISIKNVIIRVRAHQAKSVFLGKVEKSQFFV